MIYMANAGDTGTRLDVFLAEREMRTRSASQKLIEDGCVTVNGEPRGKNYLLREGDAVELTAPEPVTLSSVPQNIPLDIVYEDASLAVVNKPKGMVVHPAAGNPDGTLVNALLYHCGESLSGINGVLRPGIVHRIDKDTSGLLVIAKNDRAHVSLASQIASHSFERLYNAVVIGRLREPCGTVDAPIGRHPADRKKMAAVPGGRAAVTRYRTICEYAGHTHVELRLETGRTHQIRVHMAKIGHPVLGDTVYGSGTDKFERQNKELLRGQCLHAKTISFIHPETGVLMHFTSELPDYFKAILTKLNNTL